MYVNRPLLPLPLPLPLPLLLCLFPALVGLVMFRTPHPHSLFLRTSPGGRHSLPPQHHHQILCSPRGHRNPSNHPQRDPSPRKGPQTPAYAGRWSHKRGESSSSSSPPSSSSRPSYSRPLPLPRTRTRTQRGRRPQSSQSYSYYFFLLPRWPGARASVGRAASRRPCPGTRGSPGPRGMGTRPWARPWRWR